MATKLLVILSVLLINSQINGDESTSEDLTKFAEMAAELFQSQGAQGLGSVVQGLMGNAISSALSGADMGGDSSRVYICIFILATIAGQVLRGLGNMVGPDAQGIDTDVISGIFGMIGNSLDLG